MISSPSRRPATPHPQLAQFVTNSHGVRAKQNTDRVLGWVGSGGLNRDYRGGASTSEATRTGLAQGFTGLRGLDGSGRFTRAQWYSDKCPPATCIAYNSSLR